MEDKDPRANFQNQNPFTDFGSRFGMQGAFGGWQQLTLWNRIETIKDRFIYHCPMCEQRKRLSSMGPAGGCYGLPYNYIKPQDQKEVCPMCKGKGFIEVTPIELEIKK